MKNRIAGFSIIAIFSGLYVFYPRKWVLLMVIMGWAVMVWGEKISSMVIQRKR